MEIYERRHPFDALAFSIPILLYMVLCLLVMARPELLRGSVLRIFFYVLSGVFLAWFVFSFGIRVRRYLQLCVKRVPALIIAPDRLCIFTPFAREPLPLDWNAISDFETFHARGGNYCLPVYKKHKRVGLPLRLFPILRPDYIELTHLAAKEDELLAELRSHLKG
jgi:hypothetical protein